MLSWEEYLGFRGHFVGKEAGFPRDVLAQEVVAELRTVDPEENQYTSGAVPSCGLNVAFGFSDLSYRT